MISIDGSAGGGQILRTALSLSIITNTAVRIEDVRGGRPEPGLKPQHLAAVDLAGRLCEATIDGAKLGSETVRFTPSAKRHSELSAQVGTAGSVTLLFDTVLPVLVAGEAPYNVVATGGTDVKWAPTIGYLSRVKLPLLSRFGVDASIDLEDTGYYPIGGGRATLEGDPSPLTTIELLERGELLTVEIHSKAADELEEREVAERQAERADALLSDAGFPTAVETVDYVSAPSLGSTILLCGNYEGTVVGFDELGAKGLPAESVAERAVHAFEKYHATDAVVDATMADQIMLYLALAGGRVRIPRVTEHVAANRRVFSAFGSDLRVNHANGSPTLAASPGFEQ